MACSWCKCSREARREPTGRSALSTAPSRRVQETEHLQGSCKSRLQGQKPAPACGPAASIQTARARTLEPLKTEQDPAHCAPRYLLDGQDALKTASLASTCVTNSQRWKLEPRGAAGWLLPFAASDWCSAMVQPLLPFFSHLVPIILGLAPWPDLTLARSAAGVPISIPAARHSATSKARAMRCGRGYCCSPCTV